MSRPARIGVVIPAYNHAAYVGHAIASVLCQDWPDVELHLLDDGSSDGTLAAAESALRADPRRVRRLDTQANAGAAATLNRLIAGCDTDLVAILNSDDVYRPGRLTAMAAMAERDDFLAFSGVAFDAAAAAGPQLSFEDWYRGKLAYALSLPSCGFALVSANLAISSSNFVFSRKLFDRIGGFNETLPLTHDWEFLLKALRWAEPCFVPGRLLYYRTHPTNSFRQLSDIRVAQSEAAHAAYFAWAACEAANIMAPIPSRWPRFFPVFARSCAPAYSAEPLARFLPETLLAPAEGHGPGADVEDTALRNLLAAARRRPDNLRKNTDDLLEALAGLWSGMRARVHAHA